MNESYYRINCWFHNRKGPSFAIELREANGQFSGTRQDEVDSPIPSIREGGKIDRNAPHRQFSLPFDVVMPLLIDLEASVFPVLPPITGGFDGVNYHVRIQNGESIAHFSWWLQCPEQWAPLQTFWEQVVELSRT